MALILNIETSTYVCSVCLGKNGEIISLKENKQNLQHAKLLTVFIDKIFKESSIKAKDLDAVAISAGPGSFTGLRIGTATAKGICYGAKIPLIAISTLKSLAFSAIAKLNNKKNILLCPMINLKGMEVFTALFNLKGEIILQPTIHKVNDDLFSKFLENNSICFLGERAEKCEQFILKHNNTFFLNDIHPSAANLSSLSENAFRGKEFQNIAYFEPYYLKDFLPTSPKKNRDILSF